MARSMVFGALGLLVFFSIGCACPHYVDDHEFYNDPDFDFHLSESDWVEVGVNGVWYGIVVEKVNGGFQNNRLKVVFSKERITLQEAMNIDRQGPGYSPHPDQWDNPYLEFPFYDWVLITPVTFSEEIFHNAKVGSFYDALFITKRRMKKYFRPTEKWTTRYQFKP